MNNFINLVIRKSDILSGTAISGDAQPAGCLRAGGRGDRQSIESGRPALRSQLGRKFGQQVRTSRNSEALPRGDGSIRRQGFRIIAMRWNRPIAEQVAENGDVFGYRQKT
jgi:hypothetical protein